MTHPHPFPPGARPVLDLEDPRADVPGYAVRADGTVLRYAGPRRGWIPLAVKTAANGFRRVSLRLPDGRVRETGVALLVLRAFAGPRRLGDEPLHYPDPDPGNNRLENLRWAPRGASKIGRMLGPPPPITRGEDRVQAVLTEADVRRIRSLYRAGVGYQEVAESLDAAPETVRHVLIGRTWSHVPDPLGPIVMRRHGPSSEESARAKLDWDQVREVRALHGSGLSYRQVALRFAVDRCTVRDIVKGRTWKEGP